MAALNISDSTARILTSDAMFLTHVVQLSSMVPRSSGSNPRCVAVHHVQGFQSRKDRRKPQQKVKDAALLARIREAEAGQGFPELDEVPSLEPKGPILDSLTSDERQLELWIAVGRGLISSSQPQACQQMLEDGLTAFGRYGTQKSICFYMRVCHIS